MPRPLGGIGKSPNHVIPRTLVALPSAIPVLVKVFLDFAAYHAPSGGSNLALVPNEILGHVGYRVGVPSKGVPERPKHYALMMLHCL